MTNPNTEYKRAWVALREKLGREPRASDPEYWELTNRLTKAYEEGKWIPEKSTVNGPIGATSVEAGWAHDSTSLPESGTATPAARQSRATSADKPGPTTTPAPPPSSEHPTSPILTAEESPEAGSEPEANSGASGAAQRAQEPRVEARSPTARPVLGSRGPNGGLYALCEGCGVMWEREKRRGRPQGKCEGCR